jgi:hypothetical protein
MAAGCGRMTPPDRIEKVMSLTAQEFNDTLAHVGTLEKKPDGTFEFVVEDGTVSISYVPLPSVTFGGLLTLPRAKVTLAFDGVSNSARETFLKHFDLMFKRGGG